MADRRRNKFKVNILISSCIEITQLSVDKSKFLVEIMQVLTDIEVHYRRSIHIC